MKQKKIYPEILRVLAIVLVIYNHTRSAGYTLYQVTDNLWTYYGSLTLSIFCKIAVPLFFMISGVTLLGKTESIRDVYCRRVLRMLLVILIFTFLQYLRIVRVHPENGFSLVTYLAYCYSGNIIEPYWFLKTYLSMLLILPLLRVLAQNMKKEHFYLLLGIRALSTVITAVHLGTGYSMNVTLVRNQVEKLMPWIRQLCGPLTACLLFVLLSTVAGLAVIWLVRKLPYVKKLI